MDDKSASAVHLTPNLQAWIDSSGRSIEVRNYITFERPNTGARMEKHAYFFQNCHFFFAGGRKSSGRAGDAGMLLPRFTSAGEAGPQPGGWKV
jgi:hypothetical protein